MAYTYAPSELIAIIGSSCRFPGNSSSPSKLWALLRNPCDLSREVPANRFKTDGFYHVDGEHHGATNVNKSYWLEEDHRVFDAGFFSITPREAEVIDPQQRLLLEAVYEAMESAGLTLQAMQGSKTSVYVGTMTADFHDVQMRDTSNFSQYMGTGTSRAIISNRISYFFNWSGPSMTIDTACSSSLVAIHQAVQSLCSGESRVSCVSGANVMLGPEPFIAESSLHMLSPSGKSQMWDANADGYARGEGVAVVFLKTLSSALADGDHIEGIIRETGVNSDGRTKGITMPSSDAQAALINQTYLKSGLDPTKPGDRCQYFEAHGTGTQAGDPREAAAISKSFFGTSEEHDSSESHSPRGSEKLLVGSVKTVIGHTEGAAGIAGLLKVSLAMQHRLVPPNQHLHLLNPSVAPFYKNLKIPTVETPWPSVPSGQPLRSSVNSFGFGGTNAHAILESYEPDVHNRGPWSGSTGLITQTSVDSFTSSIPLLLSANSEKGLAATVENYLEYLKLNDSVNLRDLTWTLSSRRSAMPVKAFYSGSTREEIIAKMDKQLSTVQETPGTEIGTRSKAIGMDSQPRILGVFTGQGAQWPGMGKDLILRSEAFHQTIEMLEKSLAECPDPPTWSLEKEIMAPSSESRLLEAALSQPLCTALQIALVDILRTAGVNFHTVVGHSSGEIGAAYATGTLSAQDAIRIAYYRGVHAKLAEGPNGMKGAMMAAGFDIDEAMDFCDQSSLQDRIVIAASNSSNSVTLSGDLDAIEEAKAMLDADKKFARVLKVDTAYHSHHMDNCAKPYLASLAACNIKVRKPRDSCVWISSVYGPDGTPTPEELVGRYWRDNMVGAVLFTEAVERALGERGPFDVVLEVGPHAALKGPATQTLKEITGNVVPYSGVLDRMKNDVIALGDSLGFLWAQVGATAVDFESYAATFESDKTPKPTVVKNLPTYPWDHSQVHWRESRLSKQYLNKTSALHELLGARTSDDTDQELRWRNILKSDEVPWLRDHRFQGQLIVPAAAYCVMALEASKALSPDKPMQMVELQDLQIHNAISIEDDSQGVETMFSLSRSHLSETRSIAGREVIQAVFALSSAAVDGNRPMRKALTGRLVVQLGAPTRNVLPPRPAARPELYPMDLDEFYTSMSEIGLGYTGPFRALVSAQRRMHISSATLEKPHSMDSSELPVRPALLDVCFQAAFAAFAAPGDMALWTAFLPQRIHRLRFNLAVCDVEPGKQSMLDTDAYITNVSPTKSTELASFTADIDVFNSSGQMEIQIEGITVGSFALSTKADDRELYLHNVWDLDISSGAVTGSDLANYADDLNMVESCERIAFFYLRNLKSQISPEQIPQTYKPLLNMLDSFSDSSTSKIWENDSRDNIMKLMEAMPSLIDVDIMRILGDNLPSVLRGETTMDEHMSIESMWDRFLQDGLSFARLNRHLGRIAQQIAHRYPRMSVLEIGAGRGSITRNVLEGLNSASSSYTFTDVDSSSFEHVQEVLKHQSRKMVFKTLDVEHDTTEQGFTDHSYDLVIACYALYGRHSIETALENTRRLVKPGGYLVFMEPTSALLRLRLITRGLPKLWSKGDNQQTSGVSRSPVEWDQLLRESGFSGLDSIIHDFDDAGKHGASVMVSQAVDEQIEQLRQPLPSLASTSLSGQILIVGGKSLATVRMTHNLVTLLANWNGGITTVESFEMIDLQTLPSITAALILADLDESVIKIMNAQKLGNMQEVLSHVHTVLWLTSGFRDNNPYHTATVGLGRCAVAELPQLRLQFLDVDATEGLETIVAESFVRLIMADLPELNNNIRLWTTELEIALERGKMLIPRILPLDAFNERLNSTRRVITEGANTTDNLIEIVASDTVDGTSYHATRESWKQDLILPENHVSVKVSQSTLYAIRVADDTYLHVCYGRVVGSDENVIALSQSNASFITLPSAWQLSRKIEFDLEKQHLELVTCLLVANVILSFMLTGTTILYEPNEHLASVLTEMLSGSDRRLLCFTTNPEQQIGAPWVYIHPQASRRMISSLVPTNTSVFINLSSTENDITRRVMDSLSPMCTYHPKTSLFQLASTFSPSASSDALLGSLHKATSLGDAALASKLLLGNVTSVIEASDLVHEKEQKDLLTIVTWSDTRAVAIVQKPIDPLSLFSSTKTYFLVGLTGELGQSLCRWMVTHGARHLVISSRNPQRETRWRDELQAMGANIRIEPMDVADKHDVIRLHEELSKTMPPIAGVVNGAMVLSDGLFSDMSLETFEKVLRPKVCGSNNLDEVFSSNELDFFIMFSSLSAVVGNPGQANYAAANMYMAGLANQRRKRGLTASVLDIGMLVGIGYIRRQDGAEIYNNLRKQGYMPMSELDIHQIFAEAVVAGRTTSGQDPEIITGLQRVNISANKQPLAWHSNPKFSHHTLESAASDEVKSGGGTEPVKQQLLVATSAEEASEILRRCFSAQLELMLQLPPDSINKDIPIIELGVDSLVAVEIRTWFLKEVEKDMPVLKVLGGASMAELCNELAVELLTDAAVAAEPKAAHPPGPQSRGASSSLPSSDTASQDHQSEYATPLTTASEDSDEDITSKLTTALYQQVEKMSYSQSRLWFPYLYLEDKTAYNCTTSYRLNGPLNIARFERSLGLVTQRHQAFRTSFFTDPSTGQAMQAVSRSPRFVLNKIPSANTSEDVDRETKKIADHIYDLQTGDTFIATLLTHTPESHTIVFGYHHIIIDAVSWQLFLQDLEKFYRPRTPNLPAPSQHIDFSIKQRRLMETGGFQDKRNYWRSEFSVLPTPLPLFPFAKVATRKTLSRYDTLEYVVFLDKALVAKIKKASSAAKTTSFHFYLSVLQVLLYRFLDVDDLCIGIADAGRTDQAFMDTIGFLLDSLPLRFNLKKNQPFTETLRNTRSKVYSALGHSGVPFDTMLKDLHVPGSATDSPLFQILVNYRMGALKQKTIGDVALDFLAYEDARHPFDFILSIDEMDDGAGALSLSMQEYLYNREGGDLLLATYIHLLEAFASNSAMHLDDCPLFDQSQMHSAITFGTGPKVSSNWPDTLSLRVDSLVQQQPDAIAVKDITGESMTYLQMFERTSAIALALQEAGATQGSHITVLFEPSADVICSLLAIMRLGAVYIPLDVRNSNERLNCVVVESKTVIVLCHSMTSARIRELDVTTAKIVDISSVVAATKTIVANQSTGSGLALIMFTSGTTGKPKGIMLDHSSFLTHFVAISKRLRLRPGQEKVLQQSAFGYDASLWQIFSALSTGGTVVMSSNRGDMAELAALMLKEEITTCLLTPSEYSVLFQYGRESLARCASWRLALCGGEAFATHLKGKFEDLHLPNLTLYNIYGPTEVSVACSVGEVDYRGEGTADDSKVPIGPAIPNYAVYILDQASQPVPLGWVGEICVGGPPIASGYLANDDLTKAKFISDKISKVEDRSGWDTLYRTGDKGFMLADGSIVFLGRMDGDSQIKLRGIRIELDDISGSILKNSDGVLANAAVVLKGDEDQILAAYVMFAPDKVPHDPSSYLRQLLLSLPLPIYMRPAVAIPLDYLPSGAGGKLDMKALKALPFPEISEPEDTELTDTEAPLKAIWEDILSSMGTRFQIRKQSDFFAVGGNSLLLLKLQAEIRRKFNTNISLPDLFRSSSLESLASRIENSGSSSVQALDWQVETALSADLRVIDPGSLVKKVHSGPIQVVLTGSTGFLGRAILRQLAIHDGISHIHCVAVRQNGSSVPRTHTVQSDKIVSHAGDLSLPLLGMSEGEARQVFAYADAIIHNGADVSFMQTFQSLRKPNVESTKELVKLAIRQQIPIHFVSTAGVAHLSGLDALDEVSVAAYSPPVDGSDGYVASKWASERYLEKVNEHLGLPLWIYRPSSIIGDDAPSMDVMHNTLKYSRAMKAVPNLTGWKGHFNFIRVDTVASDIVSELLSNKQAATGKAPQYIHESGEVVVPVNEIKTHLEREEGGVFSILEMGDWTEAAGRLGLDELVAAFLNMVHDAGHAPSMPLLSTRRNRAA